MKLKLIIIAFITFVLSGCGGGSSSSVSTTTTSTTPTVTITLSGTITYDFVPVNSNSIGLDYNNMSQKPAKGVQVDALDSSNQSIATTSTNEFGQYTLLVPENTNIKIRVSAKMIKTGTPAWDVKVVDQRSNALYVMDGALTTTGSTDEIRDLNAPSGWDGSSYTSTRVAGPFAMLDTIYSAMQEVLMADTQLVFPPLVVNWYEGSVDGTYYLNGGLYIFGAADTDTDEYDDHVIAHEWGHYYEDKLSRSDSIGGAHGGGDILDIRLAFGEGFGNAFSAIALADPVYFDTSGASQASGFNFDVETAVQDNPGWYSEASIQRILYDLYDTTNEGNDALSLGFGPLHNVFIDAQKNTPAFTSLFTFITALKSTNTGDATAIDDIVSSEVIAPITDIYGTGRTNLPSELPGYAALNIGGTVNVCPSYTYGTSNKLGTHKFITFTISTSSTYTISVNKSNVTAATDPDFLLYKGPLLTSAISGTADSETKSISLSTGDYLLDVSDFNNVAGACFDVTIN